MTCYGVIADDLTGAMDAGVQLLEKNFVVRVALDLEQLPEWENNTDVVIVSTESRNISEQMAYESVSEALRKFQSKNCSIIYKKIDSTLRGNIGAELKAVLENGQVDGIVMAPALPFNGRTTVNGVHYVYGSPLENTELAKDPYAPVYESEISRIIHEQFQVSVGMMDIRAIRNGMESVVLEIQKNIRENRRLMVADAIDDGDLRNIVKACSEYEGKLLLCGSAGLFKYIAGMGQLKSNPQYSRMHLPRRRKNAPVLVLSGSPARMSKLQIEKLEQECGRAFVLRCSVADFLGEEGKCEEICEASIRLVLEKLSEGFHVVVDASGDSKEDILNEYQNRHDLLLFVRKKILDYLERIAVAAVAQVSLRGMVLFGGDTAVAITKKLGGRGMEIIREIEPYIPLGIMLGGAGSKVPVVTKSGGFGREDSLVSIIKKLEQ